MGRGEEMRYTGSVRAEVPMFSDRMTNEQYQQRFRSMARSPAMEPKRYRRKAKEDPFGFLIREVLHNIRRGEQDYVFREAHIAALLEAEPDRLRCWWYPEDGCWMVWLAGKVKRLRV